MKDGGAKSVELCGDEYVSHDGKVYRCEEIKGHSKFRKCSNHRRGETSTSAWSVMWNRWAKARLAQEREAAHVKAIVNSVMEN